MKQISTYLIPSYQKLIITRKTPSFQFIFNDWQQWNNQQVLTREHKCNSLNLLSIFDKQILIYQEVLTVPWNSSTPRSIIALLKKHTAVIFLLTVRAFLLSGCPHFVSGPRPDGCSLHRPVPTFSIYQHYLTGTFFCSGVRSWSI